MILVLGSSGYIGQAFVRELKARQLDFCGPSGATFDYTDHRFFGGSFSQGKVGFFPQIGRSLVKRISWTGCVFLQ